MAPKFMFVLDPGNSLTSPGKPNDMTDRHSVSEVR